MKMMLVYPWHRIEVPGTAPTARRQLDLVFIPSRMNIEYDEQMSNPISHIIPHTMHKLTLPDYVTILTAAAAYSMDNRSL